MITGRPDLQSAPLRELGYRRALAAAGVEVDEALLAVGGYERGMAAEATRRLLALPERPTAIFAANDSSAIGTLDAAAELGLRAPGDLSVVGFDNIPESALSAPALTTVDQHVQQLGYLAMQMLTRLIRGEEIEQTHITLPTELVVRGSTGPARP